MKAFQLEFRTAIKNKNSPRKTKFLNLFEAFEKNRPIKTFGSYMDQYSKETELGELIVNYTPLDYFNTVVQILDLDTFTKKSGVEIKYLKLKHEYFIDNSLNYSSGFPFMEDDNEFYWKKKDLVEILKKIYEFDNLYLIPWYARIFPYFKRESGLELKLNDDLILKKYKTSEDNYIQNSILKILIINNPDRALLESNLFFN